MKDNVYTSEWFAALNEESSKSARDIVPILLEISNPTSIIDVGCGVGAWLQVFREHGLTDVMGLDGDYIKREMLLIPTEQFRTTDLKKPFELPRTFDLAICLEVAEHIPPESADGFIDCLTKLAPLICFSAAIPHQGGTSHINEQWPEYWAQKFSKRGYVTIDCLRHRLWNIESVAYWYAQNMFVFCRQDQFKARESLLNRNDALIIRSLIHPKLYLRFASKEKPGFLETCANLPRSLIVAIKRRLGRR